MLFQLSWDSPSLLQSKAHVLGGDSSQLTGGVPGASMFITAAVTADC